MTAHRPSHGIDVAALERSADEVISLVRTEELRQLAIATRDAALARERARLDRRWTWCGSRPAPEPVNDPDYINRLLGDDW